MIGINVNFASEKRKTPIVLFMNSDKKEVNKIISNTIKQKVGFLKFPAIPGKIILAPSLSNICNQKSSENSMDEVFPLFALSHVDDKFKSHPKLETVLVKFYSCFIKISHLVVIALKKDYVSYQIQMLKKNLFITKICKEELKTHNLPDFLFVINDNDFVSFDQEATDLLNKSKFVMQIKNEFDISAHFCLINIDNVQSYNNYINCLNEILIFRVRMIFERHLGKSNLSKFWDDFNEREKKLFGMKMKD